MKGWRYFINAFLVDYELDNVGYSLYIISFICCNFLRFAYSKVLNLGSMVPKDVWIEFRRSMNLDGKKNYIFIFTNLRDITLSTKVHLVKAMVFPVVMYGCESWT